jgi:hypothetical protein
MNKEIIHKQNKHLHHVTSCLVTGRATIPELHPYIYSVSMIIVLNIQIGQLNQKLGNHGVYKWMTRTDP